MFKDKDKNHPWVLSFPYGFTPISHHDKQLFTILITLKHNASPLSSSYLMLPSLTWISPTTWNWPAWPPASLTPNSFHNYHPTVGVFWGLWGQQEVSGASHIHAVHCISQTRQTLLLAPDACMGNPHVLFCVPGILFLLVHMGLCISLAMPPSPKAFPSPPRLESGDFLCTLSLAWHRTHHSHITHFPVCQCCQQTIQILSHGFSPLLSIPFIPHKIHIHLVH